MFEEDKKTGMFAESDDKLAKKFEEAGFGFPQGAGALLFHPLEAGYLVKIEKTSFKGKTLTSFISAQKKSSELFPFTFAVYCSVRSLGRQALPYLKGMKYLRVYATGVGRNDERPAQLVCMMPGPLAGNLEEEIRVAHLARLDLIVAYGDEKEPKFCKVSSYKF
jgi:hypothetical protein